MKASHIHQARSGISSRTLLTVPTRRRGAAPSWLRSAIRPRSKISNWPSGVSPTGADVCMNKAALAARGPDLADGVVRPWHRRRPRSRLPPHGQRDRCSTPDARRASRHGGGGVTDLHYSRASGAWYFCTIPEPPARGTSALFPSLRRVVLRHIAGKLVPRAPCPASDSAGMKQLPRELGISLQVVDHVAASTAERMTLVTSAGRVIGVRWPPGALVM